MKYQKLVNLMVKNNKELLVINKKILSLPRINLNPRQLCDLELLMNGAFSPLAGFMDEENYDSVITKMRLKTGAIFPIPIILDVENSKDYKIGSELVLCDEFGKPLALFTISSIYQPNKQKEVKYVYDTTNSYHPGVHYVLRNTHNYYLGGKIKGIDTVDRFDFVEYRHTPKELKTLFANNNWQKIIGFQTRNPLHKAHYSMIRMAAQEYNAKVLLHPIVGLTKEGDIDYITRVKCYIKLFNNHLKDIAKLSLLPLAMRMAGPREAILHAIIRKNYGCTHFIVGRDHAGPGKDLKEKPFYTPYDAQKMVMKYSKEIGIKIIPFDEMVYVEQLKKYIPITLIKKDHTIKRISGTEFRKMIIRNEKIPEWFSFQEIINEIKKGTKKDVRDGLTIFFTGLPCSGKSTIARLLYFKLLECQDKKVTLLDGDIIRQNLSKGLGFSREDRITNIQRIGFVANEITKHRGIAICSAIAPHEEARKKNRHLISNNGTYIEVYVSTPINICKKRDTKALYQKAKLGLLKGFTGVDDSYEKPKNPEITIDTINLSPSKNTDEIIRYLRKYKLI